MSELETTNQKLGAANRDLSAAMMRSFGQMPSWTIVAVLSRIARLIQHFAEHSADREAINDAIQLAEDAARCGHGEPRALEAANAADRAGEAATNNSDPKPATAAFCAAEAATAVYFCADKPSLLQTTERVIQRVMGFENPKADGILLEDIIQCAKLAEGLTDSAPAPPEILDFCHYQSVHEAGHAVVSSRLGILFDTVRIIYNVGVEFIRNPIDDPEQVTAEDRRKFLLGYAAGAAAEDLIFGKQREWGCAKDRHNHKLSGGTDFDGDAAEVRKYEWFNKGTILAVASLLQDRRLLSDRDVRQALNLPTRWTDYKRWLGMTGE